MTVAPRGERWTSAMLEGGALIVAAGLLIVRYGAADVAPETGRPPLAPTRTTTP